MGYRLFGFSKKITLSGIWLLENGQLLELLNLGENTMKKLEIKKNRSTENTYQEGIIGF